MSTFADSLDRTYFFFDPDPNVPTSTSPIAALLIIPMDREKTPNSVRNAEALFKIADQAGRFLGRVMGRIEAERCHVIAEPVILPQNTQTLRLIPVHHGLGSTEITLEIVGEREAHDWALSAMYGSYDNKNVCKIKDLSAAAKPADQTKGLKDRLNEALTALDDNDDDQGTPVAVGCLRKSEARHLSVTEVLMVQGDVTVRSDTPETEHDPANTFQLTVVTAASHTERQLLPFIGVARYTRRELKMTLAPKGGQVFGKMRADERRAIASHFARIAIWTDIHFSAARRLMGTETDMLQGDFLEPNSGKAYATHSSRSLLASLGSLLNILRDCEFEMMGMAAHYIDLDEDGKQLIGNINKELDADPHYAVPLPEFRELFLVASQVSRSRQTARMAHDEIADQDQQIRVEESHRRFWDSQVLQRLVKKARIWAEIHPAQYRNALEVATQLLDATMRAADKGTRLGLETEPMPVSVFDQVRVQVLKTQMHKAESSLNTDNSAEDLKPEDKQDDPEDQVETDGEKTEKPEEPATVSDAEQDEFASGPSKVRMHIRVYDGQRERPVDDGRFIIGPFGHLPVDQIHPQPSNTPNTSNFLWLILQKAEPLLNTTTADEVKPAKTTRKKEKETHVFQEGAIWRDSVIQGRLQAQQPRGLEAQKKEEYLRQNIPISQQIRIWSDPQTPSNSELWQPNGYSPGENTPENPLFWAAGSAMTLNETGLSSLKEPVLDLAETRLQPVLELESKDTAPRLLLRWAEAGYPFEIIDAGEDALERLFGWFDETATTSEIREKLIEWLKSSSHPLTGIPSLRPFSGYELNVTQYLTSDLKESGVKFDALINNSRKSPKEAVEILGAFASTVADDLAIIDEVLRGTPDWIESVDKIPTLDKWIRTPNNKEWAKLENAFWFDLDDKLKVRLALFAFAKYLLKQDETTPFGRKNWTLSYLFYAEHNTVESNLREIDLKEIIKKSVEYLSDHGRRGRRPRFHIDITQAAQIFAEILKYTSNESLKTSKQVTKHVLEIADRKAANETDPAKIWRKIRENLA